MKPYKQMPHDCAACGGFGVRLLIGYECCGLHQGNECCGDPVEKNWYEECNVCDGTGLRKEDAV